MRIKTLMLLLLTVFAASVASAREVEAADTLSARYVFENAPLEVLDMLRPSTRLDMIDYYVEADSLLTVQNALGGQSRLQQLTGDYLRLAVTPVSTLEIKVLPCGKDFIAMTLYTVGADSIARDTEVRFFDSAMRQLPAAKFLKMPDPRTLFNIKGTDITEADLREWMPFQTMELTTGPGDAPLTATPTTLSTLPQENAARLKEIMTPSLTADWTGSAFRFRRR